MHSITISIKQINFSNIYYKYIYYIFIIYQYTYMMKQVNMINLKLISCQFKSNYREVNNIYNNNAPSIAANNNNIIANTKKGNISKL